MTLKVLILHEILSYVFCSATQIIQKVPEIKPQRETQNTISGSEMVEDDTEDRIAPVVDHIE